MFYCIEWVLGAETVRDEGAGRMWCRVENVFCSTVGRLALEVCICGMM